MAVMMDWRTWLQNVKINKPPGPDGITTNFYSFFSWTKDSSLGPTVNQGLIAVISKPDKHLKYVDNFCPITLLNNDFKIFLHILVNILKDGINNLINVSQSAFLEGRSFLLSEIVVYGSGRVQSLVRGWWIHFISRLLKGFQHDRTCF